MKLRSQLKVARWALHCFSVCFSAKSHSAASYFDEGKRLLDAFIAKASCDISDLWRELVLLSGFKVHSSLNISRTDS